MAKNNRLLSAADILRGGDSAVLQVEVLGVTKDGAPGVVCYLPISAAAMIQYQEEAAAAKLVEAEGGNPRHIERMIGMLAGALCDEQGDLLFSTEELTHAPADALVNILKAVTGGGGAHAGNVSSETAGSDSPTASLPS